VSEPKPQLSQALIDSAPEATLLATATGLIVRVNAQAETLLGYSEADLVGRSVRQLLPESLHGPLAAHLDAFAKEPRRHVIGRDASLFALLADGSELPVEVALNPVDTSSGLYVVAAVRDLSHQLGHAASLRAAAEQFRSAFQHAPVGLAICEPDGRFVEVNPALCRLTGYTDQDLLGTSLPTLVHPEDAIGAGELFGPLLQDGAQFHEREQRILLADGEHLWTALHVIAQRGADGELSRLLVGVTDTSERRQLEGQLRHLTDHDPLTGLLNRQGLEGELDRHVAHVNRYGSRGALLLLDVDHFKAINDTLGHEAGDQVISVIAARLSARLRSSDTLARLGGDEFAILLPEADMAAARRVAAAIMADIRDDPVEIGDGIQRPITVSLGVTMFREGTGSGEEVLVDADLAMFDSKEAGRDRMSLGAGGHREEPEAKSRLAWIDRIHDALENERLTLFAQPVVSLGRDEPATGAIQQHELLLRMLDEHGEATPPSAFLPIAERFDLIQEIDRWVVRQAIRLVHRQPADVRGGVEINVSGKSLADGKLLDVIQSELVRSRIDPFRITFELAETAAIANVALARSFAEGVAELGCRFALDDFGAGFGSFYYLKHIPFDHLKIGREFVTRCVNNRTDQLVIESLVGIARGLRKQTIAVGVEDGRTAAFLRRSGVDMAQGFHFGRPYPVLRSDREAGRPLRVS